MASIGLEFHYQPRKKKSSESESTRPSRLGLGRDRSASPGLGTGPGGLVRVPLLTKGGAFKAPQNPKMLIFLPFYFVESEGDYFQIVFQASNIIKSIHFWRSSLPKNPTTIHIKEGFFISQLWGLFSWFYMHIWFREDAKMKILLEDGLEDHYFF